MKKIILMLTVALCTLSTVSCEKEEVLPEYYIELGFTKQMVIDSWGEPKQTFENHTSIGFAERWNYSSGNYVYFMDGKVVSFYVRSYINI